MVIFWKTLLIALIATILSIQLGKQQKDIALLLNIGACCMIMAVAIEFLDPVIEYLYMVGISGEISNEHLNIIFRALGISISTEIVGLICADAGNTVLEKSIRFLGMSAVLFTALPAFSGITEIIRQLTGGI